MINPQWQGTLKTSELVNITQALLEARIGQVVVTC